MLCSSDSKSPVMGSMNYESNYPSLLKAEELSYSGYQHTVVLVVMKRLMHLLKRSKHATRNMQLQKTIKQKKTIIKNIFRVKTIHEDYHKLDRAGQVILIVCVRGITN